MTLYYFIKRAKEGAFVTTMEIGEFAYSVYGKQSDGYRRFMVSGSSGYATKAIPETLAQNTAEIMLTLYDLERRLLDQLNERGDDL